jgi:hypothetical protein
VTWSLDAKALFNWKDEEKANFERKVKRFFSRERFLSGRNGTHGEGCGRRYESPRVTGEIVSS